MNKKFRGSTGESAIKTGCHVVFQRSTAVLRTTFYTPTEPRATGQLRDRQLAVVVTCPCVGGPCALPLVRFCLCKTCGVLDGLTAAAHQNVRYSSSTPERPLWQQHTKTSARTTYHSCRKCNIFFYINMIIKRLLYIRQSDASTTKLAIGTRTAL